MHLFNILKFIVGHPLNKKTPIKAIIQFVKWQISSRLHRGYLVFDWVEGSRFMVRSGETGLTGNIYTGLHEFSDMSYLLHVLREDDLFIDVGANLGSYSILACSAIGARGYAFEPVPKTYNRLQDNIYLNGIEDKVTCMQVGVGKEKGAIEFTANNDTTNHALAKGEQCNNSIVVQVVTLNDILKDENPTLIKIDTEGFETEVLEGALEIINKPSLHSVIIELNESGRHYGFDESRIHEIMKDNGFETYSYDPFNRKLYKLDGKNLNSGNTIFIKDIKLILEKIQTAPQFSVYDHVI